MNREEAVWIASAHRDTSCTLGITRLAPIGAIVHNQGSSCGDVEFVVDGVGKDFIEVVV